MTLRTWSWNDYLDLQVIFQFRWTRPIICIDLSKVFFFLAGSGGKGKK